MAHNAKKIYGLTTIVGVLLFSIIYFGFETKPKDIRTLEMSRMQNIEVTGIQNLLRSAKDSLEESQIVYIENLNKSIREQDEDSLKVSMLEELSKTWFDFGFPIISGFYAEEIAAINEDHNSYALAGTTYILGLRNAKSEKEQQFAKKRAIENLEKAISLQPDNVSNQVNLALVYVDFPDTNPMQGILMLRDLNEKYPNDVGVLNQLGRLAIQTNQVEKALERLNASIRIDPEKVATNCLLATAHKLAGNEVLAEQYKQKCIN